MMDSLYASLAQDLGVAVSELPQPPSIPPTPSPILSRTNHVKKPPPLRHLSLPPQTIRAAIYEAGQPTTPPSSRPGSSHHQQHHQYYHAPPSPTGSTCSLASLSSTTSSATFATVSSFSSLNTPPSPRIPNMLRRMPSPRKESLRALRIKESEACLQRAYEKQTLTFLDGPLFRPMIPPKSKLRSNSIR